MDIYQIFITHNRMWSGQEILVFAIFYDSVVLLCVCSPLWKINKVQAAAGLLLLVFLGIVYDLRFYKVCRNQTIRTDSVLVLVGSDQSP